MAPEKKPAGASTFLMLLGVLVVVFLMFDPNLRTATAIYVGYAFDPLLVLPKVWILFLVGSLMVLANTVIRHFFTDWLQMARVQEVMRAFQKEFSEARKANNTYKIKRLTEMNPELMKMQADLSTQQFKPMIFTMLLVLPIFAWLFHVVDPVPGICNTILEVPWSTTGEWCADDVGWWVIPRWILLYSLFSIPLGQVVQKALKLWEYRRVDLDRDGVPAGKNA